MYPLDLAVILIAPHRAGHAANVDVVPVVEGMAGISFSWGVSSRVSIVVEACAVEEERTDDRGPVTYERGLGDQEDGGGTSRLISSRIKRVEDKGER